MRAVMASICGFVAFLLLAGSTPLVGQADTAEQQRARLQELERLRARAASVAASIDRGELLVVPGVGGDRGERRESLIERWTTKLLMEQVGEPNAPSLTEQIDTMRRAFRVIQDRTARRRSRLAQLISEYDREIAGLRRALTGAGDVGGDNEGSGEIDEEDTRRTLTGIWRFEQRFAPGGSLSGVSSGRLEVTYEEFFGPSVARVQGLVHYDRSGSAADEFRADLFEGDWSMSFDRPGVVIAWFEGKMNASRDRIEGTFRVSLLGPDGDVSGSASGEWEAWR